MASTSVVYARVDSTLKEEAEGILRKLGVSPSSAIQMLYSQVVLTGSLPIDVRLPRRRPTSMEGMTHEQLGAELQRGLDSGRHSLDDADAILSQMPDA